jgi:hypothetical protein
MVGILVKLIFHNNNLVPKSNKIIAYLLRKFRLITMVLKRSKKITACRNL